MNENLKRIRRIMRENQKRETAKIESKPVPVKALWHSKQYDHVQSAVKQKLEDVNSNVITTHTRIRLSLIRIVNDHHRDHNQHKAISFVHMPILDQKFFDLNLSVIYVKDRWKHQQMQW